MKLKTNYTQRKTNRLEVKTLSYSKGVFWKATITFHPYKLAGPDPLKTAGPQR